MSKEKKFKAVNFLGYDYRINVLLVRVITIFLLVLNVLSVVFVLSNERFYVSNPNPYDVPNPLYDYPKEKIVPEYVRSMEFLPPNSSYGYKMPMFFQMMPFLSFMVLIGGALFNDRKYNKGVLF